jgi:hypothetical protein
MKKELAEIRNALVDRVAALVPFPVESCGGGFDINELRRHITRSPIVLIAILQIQDFEFFLPGFSASVNFSAFIITRDSPANSRDELAMNITLDVMKAIAEDAFGPVGEYRLINPATIQAVNLYSGSIDSVAVALWAVNWTASVIIH